MSELLPTSFDDATPEELRGALLALDLVLERMPALVDAVTEGFGHAYLDGLADRECEDSAGRLDGSTRADRTAEQVTRTAAALDQLAPFIGSWRRELIDRYFASFFAAR